MLRVEGLSKRYGLSDRTVSGGISDVTFDVKAGEFYTLLGPSGCGKTTTLRSIAGLEEPAAGHISIDGRAVFDSVKRLSVPANQRNIGMVFQSYAVWPHMTVFDNTAFPLKMSRTRRYSTAEITAKVRTTLETMGLAPYAERSAALLSGGQQQRLSLARALVAEPRLLLLDEPLSNLDALLREQMRTELRRLQKEVGVTAIYVTHDQSEALALSDRIAVMRDGGIVQVSTPTQIYHEPCNEFVAGFVGRSNMLRGELAQDVRADTVASVQTALGQIECRFLGAATRGEAAVVVVRPEHIVVTSAAPNIVTSGVNRFAGTVESVVFLGETTEYVIRTGNDMRIIVRTSSSGLLLANEPVTLTFPAGRAVGLAAAAAS